MTRLRVVQRDLDATRHANLNYNREAEAMQKEHEEYLKYPLDVDACIKKLTAHSKEIKPVMVDLQEVELRSIIARTEHILGQQPMLLDLDSPVKIVADTHGQFVDLMRIFESCGWPPKANYLFLGDMVDRGPQQIETVALLFCYKIKHPGNIFLLRGNHESGSLHRRYGFQGECKNRYSLKLWRAFVECFNWLPVAAVVDEKIFCCHGGLSPDLLKGEGLDKIRQLPRPTEVPDDGIICDLLWADPDPDVKMFQESDRGVSYLFGAAVVEKFLDKYDMDLICRGHQVETDGYSFFADRQLVTLFSAPNYCGEFDNVGGIMTVEEDLTCSFQVVQPADQKKKPAGKDKGGKKEKNKNATRNFNYAKACNDTNCSMCFGARTASKGPRCPIS